MHIATSVNNKIVVDFLAGPVFPGKKEKIKNFILEQKKSKKKLLITSCFIVKKVDLMLIIVLCKHKCSQPKH